MRLSLSGSRVEMTPSLSNMAARGPLKRPDGGPCQFIELARQKQGFNPGKMVGHENDRSIGDVFFPVNINVEF